MIGYYLSAGDQTVSDQFSPYVWGDYGFGALIKKSIRYKKYGEGLELLLIKYYVHGKFSSYLPLEPKVGNYSKANKDISVDIGVPSYLFHEKNEFERREFIVDSTIHAVELVKNRLLKKKLDVDFDSLLYDLKALSKDYLKREEPYSTS